LREVRKVMQEKSEDSQEAEKWVTKSRLITKIEQLPGDASTRKYFRIFSNEKTLILMKMEAFHGQKDKVPFLEVAEHLAKSGVRVPEVLEQDAAAGYILLEDLGDTTLLHKLRFVADTDVEKKLYYRVIDELVKIHYFASPPRAKGPIRAFELKFDFEKLFWEVGFAIEHFYERHLDRKIISADRKIMDEQFSKICVELANEPTVFCQRDFHCRNIMALERGAGKDELVMIDFQDARMGPAQYDLASLLKDSYYQLEERQVENCIEYYISEWQKVSGQRLDAAMFRRIFDLMAVQRNFKAIGTFASIYTKRRNSTYLKYVGNTFENIRRTLLKYPEFAPLREALFYYYYF